MARLTTKYLATQPGFLHICQVILPILTIVGLHITGDLYDYDEPENSYWTGAFWGTVVGILGLEALAVVICTLFVPLPGKILKIYYFLAGALVLTVASVGLGVNHSVENYNECKAQGSNVQESLQGLRMRCDYGFLINRFIIYIISVMHTVLYGVSFCVTVSNNKPVKLPENDNSTSNSGTTTTTTMGTYGDSKTVPSDPTV